MLPNNIKVKEQGPIKKISNLIRLVSYYFLDVKYATHVIGLMKQKYSTHKNY